MTYPPFDLEKALAGEPLAYLSLDGIKKGYIHQMCTSNKFFIKYKHDGMIHGSGFYEQNDIGSDVLGMWQEPVKFDYWHLLSQDVTAIKRDTAHKWTAIGIVGEPFASYNINTLKPDFFPACEIGTIIKRPD